MNRGAHILYRRTLGYTLVRGDERHYADNENVRTLHFTPPKDPDTADK